MAPKLTRYLKQVFAADEWSAKPPFLRGIYFTSALQQGRVLDEAVAKALGIPLEGMESSGEDDGMSLAKNRTYFVRDLFLEKIFKEKGLVTKSDKVRSQISGWKLWLPACFVLGLLLFGAMGWFTNRPGTESDRWSNLFDTKSDDGNRDLAPLSKIDAKTGKGTWAESGDGRSVLDLLAKLGQDVKKRPDFGWVFVPAQWFDGGLKMERRQTYANIVARAFGDLVKEASVGLDGPISQDSMKESHWKALKATLVLKHGKVQGDKLILPGGGEPQSLEAVIGDLVGYLGMNDKAKSGPWVKVLAGVVADASVMESEGFNRALAERLGDLELVPRVNKMFKTGSSDDLGKFVQQVGDVSLKYQKVAKSVRLVGGVVKEADVQGLTDDIGSLKMKYPELLGQFGSALGSADDEEEAGKDKKADPREEFRAWVEKIDPTGIMGFAGLKQDESSSLDDDGKKLLRDEGKLLNGILAALTPAGEDGLFSVAEIDVAIKSAEDKPKAGDVDSERLAALRKWWFEKRFFPRMFADYLRRPLVRDGKPGTSEEIYVLLRLISLAEKLGAKVENMDKLTEVATGLFDLAKLKPGNLAAVRKCAIAPSAAVGVGVKVEILNRNGESLAIFDTRINAHPKPAEGIPLDEPLQFRVEDTKLGEASKAWCIIDWRFGTVKQGWGRDVYLGDKGLTLEVRLPEGVELPERWPELSDFPKAAP